MKTEIFVKWFIFFIILVKTVYSLTYYGNLITSNMNYTFMTPYQPQLLYWKHVTEFIFIIGMSALLIYYFSFEHVQKPLIVDKETRLLFILYAVILIFTADWTIFFSKDSNFVIFMNKIK